MDRRIDNLHILRAVFTMGIVLDHINIDDLAGYSKKIFSIGTTGVAFFFVLSGFLMMYASKSMKCSEYLKKRFLRIFPALWIYTLGTVLLDGLFRKYVGWAFAGWTDIDFRMIVKSLLCIPVINHSNEIVIPPAWTLSYEVLFYIIGIVLILAGEKMYFYVLSVWTVLIVVNVLIGGSFFVFNSMFLELIMGVAIAYIVKKNIIKTQNILLIGVWGGVILFVTAMCSVTEIIHIEYINSLPHWMKYGMPAALIILGTAGSKSLLKSEGVIYRILSLIADYSYSIYLTHYITIRWMQLIFRAFSGSNIILGKGIRFFTIFIVCVMCGIIAGKLIEDKVAKLLKNFLF